MAKWLTTVDNPWDPRDEFQNWLNFDIVHGYKTCETLDEEARLAIFKVHTKDMPLAEDVDLKKLAKNTDGYVGADIEAVCREAAMLTLRNNLEASEIPYKYFKDAIDKVKPGNDTSDEQLVQYM